MTAVQEHVADLHRAGEDPVAAPPATRGGPSAPSWYVSAAALGHGLLLAAMLVPLFAIQAPVSHALPLGLLVSFTCVAAGQIGARAIPRGISRIPGALLAAILAFVVVSIGAAWLPTLQLGLWMPFAAGGVGFTLSVLHRSSAARERLLIIGGGDGSAELVRDVARHEERFEVVAIVGELGAWRTRRSAVPLYEAISDLEEAIETHRPDLVVVNVERGRPEVFRALLDLAGSGFRMVGLPELYEHAFGRVPVTNLSSAWFMSVLHLYQRSYSARAKRAFDVTVASLVLLLALPLSAVAALFVGRPIFYRQTRVGEWGRTFTLYKLRTMREGAEEDGSPMFAAVDDPRVTRVGRILRRTRLDELPQLWNVLLGDMSIVGPRPERPEFFPLLEDRVPWWTRRSIVKPGITGWAQVNSGYAGDVDGAVEKLSYDLWYLRHRSIVIDLMICLRTVPMLVGRGGARRAGTDGRPRRLRGACELARTPPVSLRTSPVSLRTPPVPLPQTTETTHRAHAVIEQRSWAADSSPQR